MIAKRIVVIMLLAIAFFILAGSGTSFAFIGWIMGFLLLVLALVLLTGEAESRAPIPFPGRRREKR